MNEVNVPENTWLYISMFLEGGSDRRVIGANKNLACDDMEAHAKYLVCLLSVL